MNSLDSVEGGEPLLDRIGCPRRLAMRVSDTHDDGLYAEPDYPSTEMEMMDMQRCRDGRVAR